MAKDIDSSDAETRVCSGKDPDISIEGKGGHEDIGELVIWKLSS
jgi:hypothetical protein